MVEGKGVKVGGLGKKANDSSIERKRAGKLSKARIKYIWIEGCFAQHR